MHIFISYKRDSDPDVPVARQICNTLRQDGHEVFIDRDMTVGAHWAERIENEMRRSDFLVTLLSEHSVHSEMVRGEIEMAYNFGKEQKGRPRILPVRLSYREAFANPLSAWLNPINWALWDNPDDTPRLLDELRLAISGGALPVGATESKESSIVTGEPQALPLPMPSAQPAPPARTGGGANPGTDLYVVRRSDQVADAKIKERGVTITIKAPRQMGKSSLLVRTNELAAKAGKRVAMLDFQLIDRAILKEEKGDNFFRTFCSWLSVKLELEDEVERFWKYPLGNSQRCTLYMERHILKGLGSDSLVLAMDEVDNVLDTAFRIDFFGMLRSWHGMRGAYEPTIWNRLDLALVISTEPYQLIGNLVQSPFNVGEVIELADFTPQQVGDLNRRHANPLTPDEVKTLFDLLSGHPYLTRRALYLVASQSISPQDLFAQATDDGGPFGDHLRYHLLRLHDRGDKSEEALKRQSQLVAGLCQVIEGKESKDRLTFFRLRGAGLVCEQGKRVVPRCKLYAEYFGRRLNV
jgi:hypothetical protein